LIVLDASALIAFLSPSDALHERAVARLLGLGPQAFAISPITHAEVLVGPTRAGTLDRTRAALTALGIEELALPSDAAPRLAALRATTSLKLPDCCVILAAQQSGSAVLTFDDRLAAVTPRVGIELANIAR
jgi:predicted nucleic acid-binding protein